MRLVLIQLRQLQVSSVVRGKKLCIPAPLRKKRQFTVANSCHQIAHYQLSDQTTPISLLAQPTCIYSRDFFLPNFRVSIRPSSPLLLDPQCIALGQPNNPLAARVQHEFNLIFKNNCFELLSSKEIAIFDSIVFANLLIVTFDSIVIQMFVVVILDS